MCNPVSIHRLYSYINSRIFTHYTIKTKFSYLLNPHHPFLFKYWTWVFCKSFTIFLKLIQQWQKPISQIWNFLHKHVSFHIIIKILTTNCKFPTYQNTFNKTRAQRWLTIGLLWLVSECRSSYCRGQSRRAATMRAHKQGDVLQSGESERES